MRCSQNGADVNHVNHVGDSALHNAVRNDAKDVVELLLENGARISLMNHKRETAQDLAKVSRLFFMNGVSSYS